MKTDSPDIPTTGRPGLAAVSAVNGMPRLIRGVLAVALILAVLDGSDGISAQESSSTAALTRLMIGFNGAGRVGTWMPITAECTGLSSGARLALVVTSEDTRGDLCESRVAEATADPRGAARFAGVMMTGRQEGRITVHVVDDAGQSLIQHDLATAKSGTSRNDATAPQSEVLLSPPAVATRIILDRHASVGLLTVGMPAGIEELVADLAGQESTRDALRVFTAERIEDLPEMRRGYDAVDVVLLQDDFSLSESGTAALRAWVLTGGHLIVSAGANQDRLLASSIGAWIGELFGISTEPSDPPSTQDLSALQNHVAGATVLSTNRKSVSYLRMTSDQPRVLVTSLNGPLMARRSAGGGMVTLVAVELNSPPLNTWRSLPKFYEQLIFDRPLERNAERTGRTGRISSSGLSDLSTQLAAVSDAIPPGQRWSSWHAMLLILVWVAIIGPLDYLLVTRLLKRPALTWITFPLLVTGACVLTLSRGISLPTPAIVRQTHLLDVMTDPAGNHQQLLRMRSWSSLSTRDSRLSAVTAESTGGLQTAASGTDVSLNWHGRAENVFGGLYREGGTSLGRQTSHRSDLAGQGFSAIPLIADGSTAFLSERTVVQPEDTSLKSELVLPPGGLLEGSFRHHLAGSVSNWMVIFGNRAYIPAPDADEASLRIQPDQTWSREAFPVRVVELKDILRRVRSIEFEDRGSATRRATSQVQGAYNPGSRDPLEILTMISLYDLAGGESFVKLRNDYLRRDQTGRSLQLNSALLIGTLDEPLSTVKLDGDTVPAAASQTIVRLFLPVNRHLRTLPTIQDSQTESVESAETPLP